MAKIRGTLSNANRTFATGAGKPMIGELAPLGFDHLWVAVGFGSNGIMSGPHGGRLVGEAAVAGLRMFADDPEARSGLIAPRHLAEALKPCRADGVHRL
jgi:glycine/D-amino acid oxidase-like deaminating enzyme